MSCKVSTISNKIVQPRGLLGFDIPKKWDVFVNYLVPAFCATFLYVLILSADIAVIYFHYKNNDEIWANITIFFMYLPVLASYILVISSTEIWPNAECNNIANLLWFCLKTAEHILFPVWSLWRFAERIFWSIDAYNCKEEEDREYAIFMCSSPRSVELYLFLQAYLDSLPQVLFQLHLLMRHQVILNTQLAHAQVLCIILNMVKISVITAHYQRFKTKQLAGTQYPWFKYHKYYPEYDTYTLKSSRNSSLKASESFLRPKNYEDNEDRENRRSSEFYLEPNLIINNIENDKQNDNKNSLSEKTKGLTSFSKPDFDIRRIVYIKGLPEDDMAGKLVSTIWWFTFLIPRILAISSFEFFYPIQVSYIIVFHFILVLTILAYDSKNNQVTRSKAAFFLFVAYVYLFVIIEFKIKFRKTKFIYLGFFCLVFLENFTMCLIWWYDDTKSFENFWFKLIFYTILIFTLLSLMSMIFYFRFNKPKKLTVGQKTI